MVDFCEECGSIILSGKKGKVECSVCGHENNAKESHKVISESIDNSKSSNIKEEMGNLHPLIDIECPKCKHGRAHFWTKQMRASDEPESQFYECEKCKHNWRIR